LLKPRHDYWRVRSLPLHQQMALKFIKH